MVDIKGLLSNPMAAYNKASQPGGALAPVTSMNQFLGDPRVNIGLAIAQGQPLGQAIMGGGLQAKQIQSSLATDDAERKIIKDIDGIQRYVDTGEPVFAGSKPKTTEREEYSKIFNEYKPKDFDNNKEYYQAVGNALLNEGFAEKGTQFIQLGAPQSQEEQLKALMKFRGENEKEFKLVKKGVVTFDQLIDATEQTSGTAAYATMIKFIKQLDDSVVREGEVRTFGNFQGLYENLNIEINKLQGKGFPPRIKADILNLARQTRDRLVDDYSSSQESKTTNLYTPYNIDPKAAFAGFEITDEQTRGYGRVYSPTDFMDYRRGGVESTEADFNYEYDPSTGKLIKVTK